MSDAAAFFANKKKKKKAFKFNANKIDAATVTPTVHVDAPALSTDTDANLGAAVAATSISEPANQTPSAGASPPSGGSDPAAASPSTGEQWDDEAMAASYARKGATAAATGATAELLDMKAFDAKRRDQDDIAERMRLEETKAQLTAAREGMEREAQRLKEERDKKEEVKKPETVGGLGGGGIGGKWVPPHMRVGSGLQRNRIGAPTTMMSRKLDTQDESLFPDLAAADKILEKQKEKEHVAYKVPKKTAVGGGATWGSRPPVVKSKPEPEREQNTVQEQAPAPAPVKAEPAPETAAPAAAPSSAVKRKPTKKKKKDLSTFKPSA